MSQGPQKPDHGGNFFMTPRRVLDSVAWRNLSLRARAILQVFQCAHTGFNNGDIALGIHAIGKRLGDQNHGANSRAVRELIEKGFLECTSGADHAHTKTRTYRITFVSTGAARAMEKATHEYGEWRPGPMQKRKFGGARTALQNPVSGAVAATMVKNSAAATTTPATESRELEGKDCVAVIAPLLDNHICKVVSPSRFSPSNLQNPRAADLRPELDTLRQWTREVIKLHGYGGARKLAQAAGIPEPALSRFRAGKGLPDQYRVPLQEACARQIPFNRRAA